MVVACAGAPLVDEAAAPASCAEFVAVEVVNLVLDEALLCPCAAIQLALPLRNGSAYSGTVLKEAAVT